MPVPSNHIPVKVRPSGLRVTGRSWTSRRATLPMFRQLLKCCGFNVDDERQEEPSEAQSSEEDQQPYGGTITIQDLLKPYQLFDMTGDPRHVHNHKQKTS
ncbi:unnamed protein product [Cylindrotheca closterium]|uniref:Uncharacterized protein n=1 Tax=Cylindrotheca closterium TaxID=2856 RepID=A0AAD2FVM5_9STRA|nr:unnamed protein product [Cylindrotheca closterium]